MTRPQTPSQATHQSAYSDNDRVWVIYDQKWELGTIQGAPVSSGESKRYIVKRDAAPAFPSGIDIEYIRKKN
ncbi:hypothetical protein AA0112_g9197 [Alternaria arborescens]|nr:hypothetical protein AA0112_g9197 [Alternaria arborescens]